jgi:hypothetical protein
MSFVPNGYLSIREALNRLGRELFPSEWTGEEYKGAPRINQRRGMAEDQRSAPTAWWGCAGQRAQDTKYAGGEAGGAFERRSFRSFLPRGVQGEAAARRCTTVAAPTARGRSARGGYIGSIYRGVASSDHSTMATAQCRSADRKGASANTAQFQHGFSPGQAIRRIKCGHQADSTGKNPRSNRSPEEKIGDGKSDAV